MSKKDNPDDIEALLSRMSSEELARVLAVLDKATREGSPLAVNIGGHMIGCAIGTGASLNARDVITAVDAVPADETQRAAARLVWELVARKLADRNSPDFARTKYAKRMGFPDEQRQVVLCVRSGPSSRSSPRR